MNLFGFKPEMKSIWLFLILFFAAWIRLKYLGMHRFHVDEALYASWAIRIFEHYDLLLNGASGIDKPPLLFYFQALSYLFFGITENAARIPNLIAGVVSVGLVYKIGRYFFSTATGLFAAGFITISPLYIAYSNTAFTDVLMVTLGLASIVALTRERYILSGILVGLSIATKQFGVFWFPFVFVLNLLHIMKERPLREVWVDKRIHRFLKGFGYAIAGLLLVTAFSNPFWGFILYLHKSTSDSADLFQQFIFWFEHYKKIFELPFLNFVGYLAMGWLVIANSYSFIKGKQTRQEAIGKIIQLTFVVFIVGYFLSLLSLKPFHYTRYAVLWVPFTAIIAGAFLAFVGNFLTRIMPKYFAMGGLVVFMVISGVLSVQLLENDTLQYGVFYRGNDGIEKVTDYLRTENTTDTIFLMAHAGWGYKFYAHGIQFNLKKDIHEIQDVKQVMEDNPEKKIFIASHAEKQILNTELLNSEELKATIVLESGEKKLFLLE